MTGLQATLTSSIDHHFKLQCEKEHKRCIDYILSEKEHKRCVNQIL